MPRPTSEKEKEVASKASSGNFISRWFAGRKERKQAAEEATVIINDAAKHEGIFITMLQHIRFNESKLPKEALEYRSNEKQCFGDLEYCARWLEQEIDRNTSPVCMDIRPLDQKLYLIVARFKEAIELGYQKTAFAARGALLDVFPKIRFRLSQVLPAGTENDYASSYVEAVCGYVDIWINLLTDMMSIDVLTESLAVLETELDKEEKAHEARRDAFEKMLKEDSQKLADWNVLLKNQEDSQLTPSQKKLLEDVIEMDKHASSLIECRKHKAHLPLEIGLLFDRVDLLKDSVMSLILPTDPESLNKYKDDIQKIHLRVANFNEEIEGKFENGKKLDT